MPIENYSVLKGKPTAGKTVHGASTHYQITVQAAARTFTVAVNIESTGSSAILYDIDHTFMPPDLPGLTALAPGMTSLPNEPNSLALDYVREQINGKPMITREQLTLLPEKNNRPTARHSHGKGPDLSNLRALALTNGVTLLIEQAIADGNTTLYALGSAYADSGQVDGIHDIHMNQGNPNPGIFASENGVWQDGALFLQMPSLNPDPTRQWIAVFLAFQSESWQTDAQGNPTPSPGE